LKKESFDRNYLLIALAAALLFIPGLGLVHLFDWDEINFAESAREMINTGDYFRVQINYEPFWEKPPFFIWLQALSMKAFGVNEFAARLPNAIVGIVTLLVLYGLGKKHYDKQFGLIWCLIYVGSFLPHVYFKSGIIDPTFNLFIFLGIYHLALASAHKEDDHSRFSSKHFIYSGAFIGLGVLTKGPVALLVTILCGLVYIIIRRSFKPLTIKNLLLFAIPFTLICFAWFGLETIRNGGWFLVTFIQYQIRLFTTQDAGHGGPFIYHFIVLLLGCFPASVIFLKSLGKDESENTTHQSLRFWMIVLFWVVLILFSIVKTKIIHYSSLCYFPLTFLVAYYLYQLQHQKKEFSRLFSILIGVIGSIFSLAFILCPVFIHYKAQVIPYIKDQFAVANLAAEVNWSGWEAGIGVFYFIIILISLFLIVKRKKYIHSFIVLFIGTAITLQLFMYIIVPKIERYSQGAAVDFFSTLQGKDCYVEVVDYKSYAHLFYTQKPVGLRKESRDLNWLFNGPIDKPVYFVTKINRGAHIKTLPHIKLIGEKNGFTFYLRPVPNDSIH
jgi:4-amino-4-deoxy-L-arabinose transferase-like glycosyltransferase